MKLSTRLLFTFIFCALVLPFVVKHFGLGGLFQQKEIKETYERIETDIKEGSKNYKDQLLASVDEMSLQDAGLKKCVIDNISKYFGISDSKGLLQSAAELKSLQCHRSGITSLVGIDAFEKLESISLTNNNIENASPLADLPSLKNINLGYGNENIENIDELSQLNNLTSVIFPDLKESFCYQADRVVENMQSNNGSNITHNANRIRCRGQKTSLVTKALAKQTKDQELSDEESQAISDYEENQSWSN